jgi:hypothetical protein
MDVATKPTSFRSTIKRKVSAYKDEWMSGTRRALHMPLLLTQSTVVNLQVLRLLTILHE